MLQLPRVSWGKKEWNFWFLGVKPSEVTYYHKQGSLLLKVDYRVIFSLSICTNKNKNKQNIVLKPDEKSVNFTIKFFLLLFRAKNGENHIFFE